MKQQPIEVENQGMMIRGTCYRPAATGRYPTVLLLHGFTGNRVESGFMFVQLARAFAKQGLAAVTFDFRHSGESDGSFDQMLVSGELDDALRMTRWLQGQPFVDRSRMGLMGHSLGGLLTACCMKHTDVYSRIAMTAPTTVNNLSRITGQSGKQRVNVGPHRLHPKFFDDLFALNPVSDCIENPRPTLLVQGSDDQAVPPAVSQAYVDAMQRAAVPLTHHVISGADHGFSKPQFREELIATLGRWFGELV